MVNGRAVEKVRQRRSGAFVVLRYSMYTPDAKAPAALSKERPVLAPPGWGDEPVELFEQAPGL